MKRITVVITARPSYSRIKTALEAMARTMTVDVVCIASALLDRYGSVVNQIKADGFTVSREIHTQVEGDHPSVQARTMGLATLDLASHFAHTRPDAVMTLADRYETLATAVAASYQNIPLVHVQGGEVTGNIDDKVRNSVTALADLHLVSNELAGVRVFASANGPVHVTGCPSIDLAARVDTTCIQALPGTGAQIDLSQPFLLVLQHPVTDEDTADLDARAIQRAVTEVGLPVVWFWPNADAGSGLLAKTMRLWKPRITVHYARQVSPDDFIRLMRQCTVMVGNSSAGIREGAFLGTPVVNIGSRQRGRLRGPNVIDVAANPHAIKKGIERWMGQPRPERSLIYGDGTAGPKIADAVSTWLTGRRTARYVA